MISPRSVWSNAFHPIDRRSIQEWGAQIELPPVLARSGNFSTDTSRHFDGPLYALRSDRVRGVRILAPVRGGKTLIADVSRPWAVDNDHASVLSVFQDDKIAEAHAETRQMPMLKSVPAIMSMLSADRHKTRKDNILFANGLPFVMTGPALGNLQSRGFKWVVLDEPWLYKPGVIANAKGRLGDFVKMGNSKFLAISQGGEEDGEWDLECRIGVLFVWHVQCNGCAKHFAPEWTIRRQDNTLAGAVFDVIKHADGSYDKEACAKSVRYVCHHCGHAHANTAKTRATWNVTGKYVNAKTGEDFDKDNPPTEVTFRWHGLIDWPWDQLVLMWLGAQEAKHVGNYAPLVAFLQKYCAEHRSERNVHDSDLPFARTKIETTWAEEAGRCMSVDRQTEDKYWVMVRAWAKTGESRRLWYGFVYGDAAVEAKRVEFGVVPDCVVIDSGYRAKGDLGVYAACVKYGWIAVKGDEAPHFWHSIPQTPPRPPIRVLKPWAPLTYGDPAEGTSKQGRSRCKLIRFSSPTLKDRVFGLIKTGLWVEPNEEGRSTDDREMDKECATQMAAEFKRPKIDKFTQKKVMIYVCPTGNNHALDCSAMQVLFAMHRRLIPAGVEMEKETEKPKEPNE